jgi:LacI family transcriptional regulator
VENVGWSEKQAVRYIRSHATEPITVPSILIQIASSRRNLEKRFRMHMGHSLHSEVVKARIEYAKTLLHNSSRTVSAIAEASGFKTLQRFHAVFKDQVGTTPVRYRSLLK